MLSAFTKVGTPRPPSQRGDVRPHVASILSDVDYAVLHPRFTWMRDYLRSIAPPDQLPSRQQIDPVALKPVLPLINMVDVLRGEPEFRFRFRLVGAAQTDAAGRNITGLMVEYSVLPDYAERILVNMRAVVKSCAPVYDSFAVAHPSREFIDSERVYFPLASNGREVDVLILIHSYPKLEQQGDCRIIPSLSGVRF
jgi:hypothetical protein